MDVTILTTVEECDAVISQFDLEKEDLDFRKTSAQRQLANMQSRSVKNTTELASVNAEITAVEDVIASVSEGPVKQEMEDRKKVLDYKKWRLESGSTASPATVIAKELEIEQLDVQITKVEAVKTDITTHKATL